MEVKFLAVFHVLDVFVEPANEIFSRARKSQKTSQTGLNNRSYASINAFAGTNQGLKF